MSAALILFAHGARDPRWSAPFEAVVALLQATQPQLPVRLAYLEFMQPDLPQAAAELAELGCTDVTVLPMFLGAGGHVRKDLPALMEQLRASHPWMQLHLRPAIGEEAEVVDAMARVALAAVGLATVKGNAKQPPPSEQQPAGQTR